MVSLASLVITVVVVVALLMIAGASFRVLRQYERGVMFTLGRFSRIR
jgi:regulator of protease activity HflC (stomatin/prohibitin superfamily)